MKPHKRFLPLVLLFILSLFMDSCNKDNDLFFETIEEQIDNIETPTDSSENQDGEVGDSVDPISFKANDDEFTLNSDINSKVLDVLQNDQFERLENVSVTEISESEIADISINDDKTITFTLKDNIDGSLSFDETFSYVATETYEDGTSSSDQGMVAIRNIVEDTSFVNFADFGAVGDGIADDTEALQTALDNSQNLIANANSNFKISSSLRLDQGFNHEVDWNGSTIIVDDGSYYGIDGESSEAVIAIGKETTRKGIENQGETTFKNLILDGNNNALRGLIAFTKFHADNIEIRNFYQPTGVGVGISGLRLQPANDANGLGSWNMSNIKIHGIDAKNNIEIGGAAGSSNGLIVYWDHVFTSQVTLNIKNLDIHDIWGSDSGCIYTESRGSDNVDLSLENTDSFLIVDNGNFYNTERRRGKLFGGAAIFNNCKFTSPNPANENLLPNIPGNEYLNGNFADAGNVGISENRTYFNQCIFEDPYGYDGRVIGVNFENIYFNDCQFLNKSDIAFTQIVGNTYVCNSYFSNGSTAYPYGANWDGSLNLDDNSYYEDGYASFTSSIPSNHLANNTNCE